MEEDVQEEGNDVVLGGKSGENSPIIVMGITGFGILQLCCELYGPQTHSMFTLILPKNLQE